MRALIAEARKAELDPEARPWLVVKVVRAKEPRQRIRILPGVMGEVLSTERQQDRLLVAARVFCDDLERYLNRTGGT